MRSKWLLFYLFKVRYFWFLSQQPVRDKQSRTGYWLQRTFPLFDIPPSGLAGFQLWTSVVTGDVGGEAAWGGRCAGGLWCGATKHTPSTENNSTPWHKVWTEVCDEDNLFNSWMTYSFVGPKTGKFTEWWQQSGQWTQDTKTSSARAAVISNIIIIWYIIYDIMTDNSHPQHRTVKWLK